jgi:hypothetical protein
MNKDFSLFWEYGVQIEYNKVEKMTYDLETGNQ